MNKWKMSFLALTIINLLVIGSAVTFLLLPSEKSMKEIKTELNDEEEKVPFLIRAQKEPLSRLINHYLEEETVQKNLQYRVELEEFVYVYGAIEAFNKEIDMTLILEPEVELDGNMQLRVKELSIGQLKLPVSYVLKYMKTYYELPSYVNIDPGKKVIDVYLTELTLKSGLSAKAESFNLKKDDITFTLYVPLP